MKATFFRRVLNMRESGILLPLLALSLLIGIINPTFFKFENIMHVLKTSGFLFIPGIAITFVLVSAGLLIYACLYVCSQGDEEERRRRR